MKKKLLVPSRGLFIVRIHSEEIFHVYVDGTHDCFSCGKDYRLVKSELQKGYPKRKIKFIHFV